MKEDKLLAILETCRASHEMFWVMCFSEVEPLYRAYSETREIDELNRIEDELLKLGLLLIDVKNNIEIKYFTLFVEGDTAMQSHPI